jgi:hypothetical protein
VAKLRTSTPGLSGISMRYHLKEFLRQ